MNVLRHLSPALALAPLCLALAPAADEVTFHPKADLALAKKLHIELEPELRNVTLKINGQDMGEGMKEILGEAALLDLTIEATDTYVKTKDGRIEELVRAFDKADLHSEFGEESNDVDVLKELGTKKVRFVWDEKDEKHTASFEGGSGDEKLIAGLAADMDVTGLLPSKPVSSGDSWEVAGTKLGGLFIPGGMFQISPEDEADAPDIDTGELSKLMSAAFAKFKAKCTYKGASEKDGVKLGTIEFEFDDKVELDLGEFMRNALDEALEGQEVEIDIHVSLTLKGQGTLAWNMSAGHVHALDMQADMTLTGSLSVQSEEEGEPVNFEASFEAGGPGTWKLTVE